MAVTTPPRPTPAAPARLPAPAGPTRAERYGRDLLRLASWSALALFAVGAWAGQVDPASQAAGRGSVLAGVFVAAGLLLVPVTAGRRRRTVAGLLGVALAVALGFASSGIALRVLLPDAWGDLAAGLSQGLGALPGVRVPYRGLDEWTRAVIVLGGTVLVTTSAVVAFMPTGRGRGRPLVSATLLGVVYAVPVVERSPDRPFASGAVFAVLLATFLWADRVRRDQVRLVAGVVAGAVVVALLVAVRVDGDRPLFDYEEFVADSLEPRNTTEFSWAHSYGPLDWPRDGREVLRVKAREGSYWKATVLADFDGTAWVQSGAYNPRVPDSEIAPDPAYRDRMTVVVRNLRSPEYVGAGTIRDIRASPRLTLESGFGTFRTGSRPLRRGDTYRADVYVPRPSAQTMRDAGSDYPDFTRRYLAMRLPGAPGETVAPEAAGRRPTILFPMWDEDQPAYSLRPGGTADLDGEQRVLDSPYARTYRLAQRLRAASATPYDFVRNVRARVMRGATYTETPPLRDAPLDAFLFDVREGYCQQFSGAMALLLRMGGVPARVASGFTSGTYNTARKEWVVRDLDAHSWVEVYIPREGWVAFDPTPAAAPPRSQLVDREDDPAAVENESGGGDAGAEAGDRTGDARIGDAQVAADESGGTTTGVALWSAVGLTGIGGLAVLLTLRRRRVRPAAAPEVDELVRALRRTGRMPHPAATLAEIERGLRDAPRAAAYVRAVSDQRYAATASPPTAAERRALRGALGAGLGPVGRARALWALPPRAPRPRWPRRGRA